MAKLTYEDKKEIVRMYDEEHRGYLAIAKRYNINCSVIRRIVRQYHIHGETSLKKKPNRKFTADLKLEIITRAINGKSKSSLGIEYQIERLMIINWLKKYDEFGYNGLIDKSKGRPPTMKKEKKTIDPNDKNALLRAKDERILELEAEVEALKKIESLGSTKEQATNKEKTIVIEELRLKYPLAILLKALDIAKSSYYHSKKLLSMKEKDSETKSRIQSIYFDNKGRYGYRRITLELRNQGIIVNHKRVKRLMKVMGLFGITPRAKYKSYKGDLNGTVKNLLLDKKVDKEKHKTTYNRNFTTSGCNQKWTTDVSEFHIPAGKLYLSPILDMHNDEIVSYDISVSPNYRQIENMLNQAFTKYNNLEGLVFHSDQGWQYQMQPIVRH